LRHEFATTEAPKLRFGVPAGRIDIETTDGATTIVDVEAIRGDVEDLKVEQHGRDIVIETRKKLGRNSEFAIRVSTPHGADVDANIASADVRVVGRLGGLEVNTASGDVHAEVVERDVKIRSASGDVRLGAVTGRADVNSASGDVQIDSAGAGGTIRSASGDIQIGEAAKRVNVQTASGDLHLASIGEGEVDAKSASGDVLVGIRQGSRLNVDARSMSGDTTSEIELSSGEPSSSDGPLVWVKAATMSGDIRIVRA
jgi:DUF4097 and DUF4098 domain-containing protein YvlB